MRTLSPSRPAPVRLALALVLGVAALGAGVMATRALWAQIEGDRGIAPVAATRDIRVSGVEVDEKGSTAQEAREAGWREAARLAWAKIGGPRLSDGQLSSLVTSIVIENEQLGPRRYIAKLGVIFDRGRATSYLGSGGQVARSAPLLLIPVTVSAGTVTVYERRNPWQRAWAEYQTGASRVDYVRPSGANGDSLLINFGQAGRRSRLWWRTVLDQYGASDVLIAIARLDYAYPGGPVTGRFTARYGPDNSWLSAFELRASSPEQLPAMLAQAVQRFDAIYTQALAEGKLAPDPTLNLDTPALPPVVAALIEQGRAMAAQEEARYPGAAPARDRNRDDADPAEGPDADATPAVQSSVSVEFPTPDAAAVDSVLGAVRGAPGVRGAATTSLALGGTSVMRVTFAGTASELAAALRGRGLSVRETGSGLAISR